MHHLSFLALLLVCEYVVRAACMHVLYFLDRLQNGPEEVQTRDMVMCNNGTGGDSDLPGSETHEEEKGNDVCICNFIKQLFHLYCFLKGEVKLCDVEVDCKSIRLFNGQPKIFKK